MRFDSKISEYQHGYVAQLSGGKNVNQRDVGIYAWDGKVLSLSPMKSTCPGRSRDTKELPLKLLPNAIQFSDSTGVITLVKYMSVGPTMGSSVEFGCFTNIDGVPTFEPHPLKDL